MLVPLLITVEEEDQPVVALPLIIMEEEDQLVLVSLLIVVEEKRRGISN